MKSEKDDKIFSCKLRQKELNLLSLQVPSEDELAGMSNGPGYITIVFFCCIEVHADAFSE